MGGARPLRLLLALHSENIPARLEGPYEVQGLNLGQYKANTLSSVLSLQPLWVFLEGLVYVVPGIEY